MDQKTIMAIDDTPDNLALLELTLSSNYNVVTKTSGKECLDSINQVNPDLILLDVHMPEMDGFEVCKALKSSEDTSGIPVIFVSAGDSLNEKMSGYEAGADDYITKPYVEEEIIAKINASLKNSSINERLKVDNKDAMETAFVAMNTAAELGIIIRFLQQSGAAESFDCLMVLFFEATEYFRLNCCAQIRTKKGDMSIRCENDSLEAQILKKMRNQGKIYDLGPRTIINEPNISLLIKNMPTDDPERYGRIKDNVNVLLAGAQTRVVSLIVENDLNESREGDINRTLHSTHAEVEAIKERFKQHEVDTHNVMNNLRAEMEELLLTLGLTEEQETILLGRVDTSTDELHSLGIAGIEIEEKLKRVTDMLGNLLN